MALIVCNECGGMVSDKATTCPHCGFPLQEQAHLYQNSDKSLIFCPWCGVHGTKAWWRYLGSRVGECMYCGHYDGCGHTTETKGEIISLAQQEDPATKDARNPDSINDWIVRHYLIGTEQFSEAKYLTRLARQQRENVNEDNIEEIKDAQFAAYQASIPKCPHCQSTSISKISALSRSVSVGLFGLASSKIGKTMQCNRCGYKW